LVVCYHYLAAGVVVAAIVLAEVGFAVWDEADYIPRTNMRVLARALRTAVLGWLANLATMVDPYLAVVLCLEVVPTTVLRPAAHPFPQLTKLHR